MRVDPTVKNREYHREYGNGRDHATDADGFMLEVHIEPSEARSDGDQSVTPRELREVVDACARLHDPPCNGET